MSAATADDVKGLHKKVEQLTNQIVDQGKTIEGLHNNRSSGAVSFFEQEDHNHPRFAKSYAPRPFHRTQKVSMPKAYVPSAFDGFGDFLRVGMRNDDGASFAKSYRPALESLAKALSINTSEFEEGGALVLPEFAPDIMAMLYESESLWGRSRQFTVAGNSMTFPQLQDTDRRDGTRHGGAIAYWPDEGELIRTSRIKFDTIDMKLDKLAVAVYLTEEMLSDSAYLIEQFVTEVVQSEIDYQLDRAIIRANGVKKPTGILNSPGRVVQAKQGSQAAATIVAENIDNMWSRRLGGGAGDDLVWLINQDTEPQLGKLYYATGANSGQLVYNPPTGLSERPYGTIKGRPVIASDHCSTLGTEGDIILANWTYYMSINKGQVNQLSSPHVEFLRDILVLKFTFRVNGRPAYDEPILTEQSAVTRSPFVTLQTRS